MDGIGGLDDSECARFGNGKLNVQDYDITSDWLEILHDDYQRRDEASPTSVVFLRWGQHSLPAIIEENGQGLTEGFMERSFYYMISKFDEFKIEGRIEENKAMIRALEQRQLQSRMGRGQQCWSSPWASPASQGLRLDSITARTPSPSSSARREALHRLPSCLRTAKEHRFPCTSTEDGQPSWILCLHSQLGRCCARRKGRPTPP